MDDQPAPKSDWAIVFLSRLCLIAWVSAILYEAFDFLTPVRSVCLFFGPWACVIALLNSLALLMIRRQGIFFVFALIVIPPTIHYGNILKNIAVQKKWIATEESAKEAETEPSDTPSQRKFSR